MSNNEIFEKLTPIFQDVFDDDEIVLVSDLTAADVDEWDSLSHIRLIVSVEQAFGISFTAAEVSRLENVGEFADLVKSKLNG
ncbi:MAG: acyl carrier protein [Pseudomonadota bacterium]|nr:acyl carrier protein [Pseudomonadota bacterium]